MNANLRVLFETKSLAQAREYGEGVSFASGREIFLRKQSRLDGSDYYEVLGPVDLHPKHINSPLPLESADADNDDDDGDEPRDSLICSDCFGSGDSGEGDCATCNGFGALPQD